MARVRLKLALNGLDLESQLMQQFKYAQLPMPYREFKFHPERRWRADFAWIPQKLLLEVEGGHFTGGRHVRPRGFDNDCEKYNSAALLGYRLLRVTRTHIHNGQALKWIEKALQEW